MSTARYRIPVGHRFTGGTYRIQHWENWLLTDCTESEPLPDGLAHPIALFHVPILGSATSIAELFGLVGAGAHGTVKLLGYDWQYHRPLLEEVEYRCEGCILDAQPTVFEGRDCDLVQLRFELFDGDDRIATVTNHWRVLR